MNRPSASLFFLISFMIVASPAVAAVQDDFEVEVIDRALGGDDQPGLVFHGIRQIRNIRLTVAVDDGRKMEFSRPELNGGETWKVNWRQIPGRVTYRADFIAEGMSESISVEFTAIVANPFDISVNESEIDLDAGKIGFSTSGQVRNVQLLLFAPDDSELLAIERPLMFEGVQKPFEFQPPSGEIGLVKLVAMDDKGFSRNVSFTPYSVPVPHDEVNFEFGKAEIRASEERKLHAVVEGTEKALSTLGKQIRFKLFVAGYTDTVGSHESNFELSRKRAAAIASWLKAHGVRLPVCSHGFGETVLAVETPDNTPEEKNRRTIFVISGQAPHGKDFQGEADWSCH
ncbi:MAG TPA: OmpA family protein [Myxococcota bacterium]|nr:OmpA family protein [Myxococcota bacterium]